MSEYDIKTPLQKLTDLFLTLFIVAKQRNTQSTQTLFVTRIGSSSANSGVFGQIVHESRTTYQKPRRHFSNNLCPFCCSQPTFRLSLREASKTQSSPNISLADSIRNKK